MTRYNSYAMRDGDPSVYGDFDCNIFGYPVVTTIERAEDGDPRILDIFGVPMRRGDVAQHISGKNEYGERVDGGHIRELGMKVERRKDGKPDIHWNDPPQPVVIVMEVGNPRWHAPHFAQFAESRYFLTMRGIAATFQDAVLTPRGIAEKIDLIRGERDGRPVDRYMSILHSPNNVGAIRRFLDANVGVPAERFGVERVKRWTYRLAQTATAAKESADA